jgi:hypothetical protein
MGFVIQSSPTGVLLPEAAMRRLLEVVDACRGEPEVWVVYQDTPPYPAVSVHKTRAAAETDANAQSGRNFFGAVAPDAAPAQFMGIRKTAGTTFEQLERRVSRVVLYDTKGAQFAEFKVHHEGLPNPQDDIEALFFTPSSVDKYAMAYLMRVYGVDYAARERREWFEGKKKTN